MVAESLACVLPPPRPVQVPRGTPPPSFSLSRVEQHQSEMSREQTRVSLSSFPDAGTERGQQWCTPSPYLSQVL